MPGHWPLRAAWHSGHGQLAPQGRLVDVVDEGALAVDLDHRQPLAVARLQLGSSGDVDLRVRETELALQRRDLRSGALAEGAALRVVEGDCPRARDRARA